MARVSQDGQRSRQRQNPLGCGFPHVKQMDQLLAGVMSLTISRNPGVKIMVSVSVGRDQASGNFPEGPGQANHTTVISTVTGPETGVPTLAESVVLHMADRACSSGGGTESSDFLQPEG